MNPDMEKIDPTVVKEENIGHATSEEDIDRTVRKRLVWKLDLILMPLFCLVLSGCVPGKV